MKIKENVAFLKMSLCKEILHYIQEQSHSCPSFKHIPWTHRQGKEEHVEANLTLGEINPYTMILSVAGRCHEGSWKYVSMFFCLLLLGILCV